MEDDPRRSYFGALSESTADELETVIESRRDRMWSTHERRERLVDALQEATDDALEDATDD